MSWEKSPSPDGHRQEKEDGGSPNPSGEKGCKEEQNSPPGQAGGGKNSRRNKRKQSEPRRLSTSSLVVKEEPADTPDHPDDQGRLTAPGLTSETEEDYRCVAITHRQGYRHRYHPGVDELIPRSMLSLQGHTSRASSNSSEDSQESTATSLPMHPVMIYARGSGGDSCGGMISDEASKSDLDDATGSHGTGADSPELMMEEGEAMDGDSRSSHAEDASPDSGASSSRGSSTRSKKTSRSYKNLSRSRRIVANARERNRVHTISAAFEGLRRAVPSYSHNQKLSKLAILRIACSYILALANLADMDYSPDHQQMSFSECVDMCTRTLQSEGRSKRRKVPSE